MDFVLWKPSTEAQPGWRGRLARARGKSARFFARFNRWFARMQEKYGRANDRILSRPFRALAVFLALALLTAHVAATTQSGPRARSTA